MADGAADWFAELPISNGEQFYFIMQRPLTPPDLHNIRGRLNITASDARSNLHPLLHSHEKSTNTDITLYIKDQLPFPATLAIYKTSGQTIITGTNYRGAVTTPEFKVGEEVRVWAFRSDGDKLCFALEKVAGAAV